MRRFGILRIVRGSWDRVRKIDSHADGCWDDINVLKLHREGFGSTGRHRPDVSIRVDFGRRELCALDDGDGTTACVEVKNVKSFTVVVASLRSSLRTIVHPVCNKNKKIQFV